ncbi:MAG: PQQ-dependent sugar dehydrogenase, partial [Dokdonella sp.]
SNPATCHTVTGSGPNYYLLGKILRLDVHNTTASASNLCGVDSGQPALYAIPPANPFANAGTFPDECAEIFNWGFRNPFRFSFDRQTGDLLIGDVGQNLYEEVDFQAAGSVGQNFQWNQCEGLHTYSGGALGCTGPAGSIKPRIEYSHSGGRCSITGGYVYRGPLVPLRGQYIFSDYCAGPIYIAANPAAGIASWSFETLSGTPGMNPIGYGEDAQGNLYVGSQDGTAYVFYSASAADPIFADGFDN